MAVCEHEISRVDIRENAVVCDNCGKVKMLIETRECQDCAFFKDLGEFDTPSICTKHLMGVSRTMHVAFKVEEGTCWTPKE